MDRRELGYTAVVGLLAGVILSDNVDLLSRAFGVSGLILSYVFGDFTHRYGYRKCSAVAL